MSAPNYTSLPVHCQFHYANHVPCLHLHFRTLSHVASACLFYLTLLVAMAQLPQPSIPFLGSPSLLQPSEHHHFLTPASSLFSILRVCSFCSLLTRGFALYFPLCPRLILLVSFLASCFFKFSSTDHTQFDYVPYCNLIQTLGLLAL